MMDRSQGRIARPASEAGAAGTASARGAPDDRAAGQACAACTERQPCSRSRSPSTLAAKASLLKSALKVGLALPPPNSARTSA